jgi:hypothetical protein
VSDAGAGRVRAARLRAGVLAGVLAGLLAAGAVAGCQGGPAPRRATPSAPAEQTAPSAARLPAPASRVAAGHRW